MSDTSPSLPDGFCYALYGCPDGLPDPLPMAVRHASDCMLPDTHVLRDSSVGWTSVLNTSRSVDAEKRPGSPATGEAGESGRFNVQR
jgi:hypothetical protein